MKSKVNVLKDIKKNFLVYALLKHVKLLLKQSKILVLSLLTTVITKVKAPTLGPWIYLVQE